MVGYEPTTANLSWKDRGIKDRKKDKRMEGRKEKRRKEGWEKGERESSVLHIMPKTLILRVRRYGH